MYRGIVSNCSQRVRIRSQITVLLALFLLGGCAGIYSIVEFEVLEPATVSFPDHVNRLIILNRAPVTFDAFREDDRKGLNNRQLHALDTIIVNSHIRGLKEVFKRSPAIRFHDPVLISERRKDTTGLEDLILTKREVTDICRAHGAGAVLSLESYSLDIDEHIDYFEDVPSEVASLYYEIVTRVSWNVYLPESPKPLHRYNMSDTIFFTEIMDGVQMYYISTAGMIRNAMQKSGMKYGEYLVPLWIQTTRKLYRGKSDSLKLASKHTNDGDWDAAFRIWSILAEGSDSTVSARALNNMAVYYELEDNLDSAYILVKRALQYDTLAPIREYREELDTRIQNKKEVLKQVN